MVAEMRNGGGWVMCVVAVLLLSLLYEEATVIDPARESKGGAQNDKIETIPATERHLARSEHVARMVARSVFAGGTLWPEWLYGIVGIGHCNQSGQW
jgi:hypothetical protein